MPQEHQYAIDLAWFRDEIISPGHSTDGFTVAAPNESGVRDFIGGVVHPGEVLSSISVDPVSGAITRTSHLASVFAMEQTFTPIENGFEIAQSLSPLVDAATSEIVYGLLQNVNGSFTEWRTLDSEGRVVSELSADPTAARQELGRGTSISSVYAFDPTARIAIEWAPSFEEGTNAYWFIVPQGTARTAGNKVYARLTEYEGQSEAFTANWTVRATDMSSSEWQALGVRDPSIYAIGNSLTWDSVPSTLRNAAWHIACSQPLSSIQNDPSYTCVEPPDGTWDVALSENEYDVVTVQPHKGASTTALSTGATDEGFIRLVAEQQPGAKIVLYEPWPVLSAFEEIWLDSTAYSPDANTVASRVYYDGLAAELGDLGVVRAPAGKAFYELKLLADAGMLEGGVSFSDFYRDDIHASLDLGRFVAHQVMHRAIYGSLDQEFVFEYGDVEDHQKLKTQLFSVVLGQYLAADFNRDGVVDIADVGIYKANFGSSVPYGEKGDANGDGMVDLKDFNRVKDGFTRAAAAVVVPEPPAWFGGLACAWAIAAVAGRARRRGSAKGGGDSFSL